MGKLVIQGKKDDTNPCSPECQGGLTALRVTVFSIEIFIISFILGHIKMR